MKILKTLEAGKFTAKVYEREKPLRNFPSCPYAILTEMATPGAKWQKSKVVSHIVYRTLDEAVSAASGWADRIRASDEAKAKRKQKAKEAQKALSAAEFYKVGDVVYCSWGFEQTQVDFYRVIRVLPKQIEVAELYQKTVEGSEMSHGMACDRVPDNELRPNGDKYRLTVRPGGDLSKISSFQYPHKWDGLPKYRSWYA